MIVLPFNKRVIMYIFNHRLEDCGAEWILCLKNKKRMAAPPKMVVLHYTAGTDCRSSAIYLSRPDVDASAHLVLGRRGEIIQLLPFDIEAWHAGRSRYAGQEGLNRCSIGIELQSGAARPEGWEVRGGMRQGGSPGGGVRMRGRRGDDVLAPLHGAAEGGVGGGAAGVARGVSHPPRGGTLGRDRPEAGPRSGIAGVHVLLNGFLILKLLIIHLLNFRRMAIFNSYLLGKAKKSVGNITLCYRNLKNIAQAKVFSRRDNPTPEVLDQRARVRVLGKLGRRLLPAVRKGFVGVGDGTTSNAFMSENMGAVEVTADHVATVDFARLKVASGLQDEPQVEVVYDAESATYSFTQAGVTEEDGFCGADDKVYGVLLEEELSKVKLVTLKTRGEGGVTSFPLPSGWNADNVHVYCFATTANGRMASDSRHVEV